MEAGGGGFGICVNSVSVYLCLRHVMQATSSTARSKASSKLVYV